MHELKVYLKSGFAKVYFYAQALVGLVLVSNSLRLFEQGGNNVFPPMISVAVGLALIGSIAIPVHLRRNLRYLPGILIALAGLLLYWNTSMSMQLVYSKINQPLLYISYVFTIFGLVQPLIDIKRFAYFGPNGIKYKLKAFQKTKISWDEVQSIDYQEDCFDLILKSGKVLTMTPLYYNSMNLRAHVDKLWHNSKNNPKQDDVSSSVAGQAV